VSGNEGGDIYDIEKPDIVPEAAYAGLAMLILGAIAAGALIPWPWERAIALVIIAGFMGLLVAGVLGRFAEDPEEWGRLTATGLILGVMAGALLGVGAFWLRIYVSDQERGRS
jgi:hypothetical protein